jgi:ABC-type nitrate/sulfonate/bicarbonate transport system permease component
MRTVKTLVVLTVAIFGWWLLAEFVVSTPFLLPSPIAVVMSYQDSMFIGAVATTARAVFAFFLGAIIGYTLFGAFVVAGAVSQADDQFSAARAIPIVAATPLFILWLGFGEPARLIVITLTAMAFTIGPLAEAAQSIPREMTILRERLAKSKLWEFVFVIVPATLPAMIGPLRVTFAVAFTTAVAVDFLGSTAGIGRVIDSARVTFNIPAIFLMLFVAAIIGLLLDRIIRNVLRHICHWRSRTNKG